MKRAVVGTALAMLVGLLASCADQGESNTRDGMRFSCRRAAGRINEIEKLFAEFADARETSTRQRLLGRIETQLYLAAADIEYVEDLDATRKLPEVESFREEFRKSKKLRSEVLTAFREEESFRARPKIAEEVELALQYPSDSS